MKILSNSILLISCLFAANAIASGEAVYNKSCNVCHAAGVAGAPKFGDKAAWAPRIALGEDALFTTVINGKGGMPPKGTCMDCSDADLKAAMKFMIDKAR